MRFKKSSALPLFISIILVASQLITPLVHAEEFIISGNGEGSTNEVSTKISLNTSIEQTNNANVVNTLNSDASTGDNTANGNLGDASIITGDIEENISIENMFNSSMAETPCCRTETSLEISGNGGNSQNSIDINQTLTTNINMDNYANIQNNIGVNANSGKNTANYNNGDVSIDTGSIIIKGDIKNGPVNNYNISASAGGASVSAKVINNGNLSKNSVSLLTNNSNNATTNSIAKLGNIVFINANTGENQANGNIGDVSIKTGDISVDFTITNDPINIGGIDFTCCEINPTPPPSPSPSPTPKPVDDGDTPYDPGNPSPGGPGPSSGGGSGSSGPQVLGLSFTGGDYSNVLSLLMGIIMLVGGTAFTQKQIWQKRLRLAKAPK